MGKKSRAKKQQDEGQVYMQRLQANLEYFRKHRPQLYEMLSNMQLQRAELVVTPGRDDVDMVVNGKSCYRGLAREYSVDEAAKVLVENPEEKRILTFAPPPASKYQQEYFADYLLSQIIEASPSSDRPFKGYIRGNFFPSMVFLGCGLGYHIESLVKKTPIVNAIVLEREPEKFAVSLYTVDWAKICSRFAKKGYSLSFAVGKADTEYAIRSLVHRQMVKDVPFYPMFSTYYNHLADVEAAKGVIAASRDLSVVTSNWSNYFNEMIRLVNTAYNDQGGISYLQHQPSSDSLPKPLVVVGSGPSLDKRMASLKANRDQVVIASAGTGLRPLIAAGIRPDFHVELDPSYLVYRFLSTVPEEELARIPLVAVNEVNPHVPPLFGKVYYYFKSDNTVPYLMGTQGSAFHGCNPTVTNAALAVGHSMGFESIYLFGTDYGFQQEDQDHAKGSVYGEEVEFELSGYLRNNRKKREQDSTSFETPAVDGGTIRTVAAYYSAKRSVEDLLHAMKRGDQSLRIFNCADGALIEGADWLSEDAFSESLESAQTADLDVTSVFDSRVDTLPAGRLKDRLSSLHKEVERLCNGYSRTLKTARLQGRRDLCVLVNQLREDVLVVQPRAGSQQATPEQLYGNQLLKGTLQHFLYVGLTHGMACEDSELMAFVKAWQQGFLRMLEELPAHFERVMLNERDLADDLWAQRGLRARDPFFNAESLS